MNNDDTKAFFGWEFFFKTIETVLRNKADIVVALVHWLLVKNSFQCAGIGEDVSLENV